MEKILEQIKESTLAWWILAIIAIVSFIWGIYTQFFSNKKRRFSVAQSSFGIIQQGKRKIKKLLLSFDNKEIQNLTVTKFAIWNSSKNVIYGTDMVSNQKLHIAATGDTTILDANIITESEHANHFKVTEKSDKKVVLDFEYVDSKEGIILQVFHTGSSETLKVEGKIKGGKPIKYVAPSTNKQKHNLIKKSTGKKIMALAITVDVLALLGIVIYFTLICFGVFPEPPQKSYSEIEQFDKVTLMIILWVMVLITSLFTGNILCETFKVGVPTKLKNYENDINENE